MRVYRALCTHLSILLQNNMLILCSMSEALFVECDFICWCFNADNFSCQLYSFFWEYRFKIIVQSGCTIRYEQKAVWRQQYNIYIPYTLMQLWLVQKYEWILPDHFPFKCLLYFSYCTFIDLLFHFRPLRHYYILLPCFL